jgi:hypothetical protein
MKTKNKTNLIKKTQMNISENITIIIPVHEVDKNTIKMLADAYMSIEKNTIKPKEVVLVAPKKVQDKLDKYALMKKVNETFSFNTVRVASTEDTSFQSQVNLGVKSISTPYFMALEMDDELPVYAIETADEYISYSITQSYNTGVPPTGIFMPLVAEMDKDMDNFLKYSNEMLWVKDVNETLGELAHSTLEEYSDFNLTGCYINTEAFKKAGMLKTNIEVTSNYEFLLRFSQGRTIKSIPYVLYRHRNGREGSLMQTYNEYHPSELQYWFEVAKSEYIFETQRELDRVDSAE